MKRLLLLLWLVGGCLPELAEPTLASRPDHDFDGDGVTEADGDCDDEDAAVTAERAWFPDGDTDGYGAGTATVACHPPAGHAADGGDCRDTDPSVHPGADERCNDIDDDCDADVDEDAVDPTAWYLDGDGDGHGAGTVALACDAPADHVASDDDCDDSLVTVHPGAEEPDCTDPTDYNCDGSTGQDDADDDGVVACLDCDDADADVTVPTWYDDDDGDGFGDGGVPADACEAPDGFVADGSDCNDGHDAVYPGATESCNGIDDDCDDLVDDDDPDVTDRETWYVDGDFDGYGSTESTVVACEAPSGYAATDDDCDDAESAIHPNAAETDCADPVDYNCDGAIGFSDGDGDGAAACEDCDDADPSVLPGGTESCNGKDDDCDGVVDDGVGIDFYQDSDKDGFGNPAVVKAACVAPSGYVADATDCDDTRATVKPGGTEACNARDDDCDGTVDEGVKSTFYADGDGDGFGDPGLPQEACSVPSGHVADATDCDDARGVVNPDATEVCDALDNDCDTLVDDDDTGVSGTSAFFADGDDDGFGAGTSVAACEGPLGHADKDGDCNDSNAAIHPGAPETDCTDTTDYNCDGLVGAVDGDGDGTFACEDCNDANPAVHPGATEVCNGMDDDCEGGTDEGVTTTYWRDLDGDGYGNLASPLAACTRPTGYASNDDDCNDASGAISPGAAEVCNGVDDDCDTVPDDGVLITHYADADGDGYGNPTVTRLACAPSSGWVADDRDCNDGDPNVNPSKSETCNGKDDDCDALVDEFVTKIYYRDADADGYGTSATTLTGCTAPSGYVSSATDCNDTDPAVNPGRAEVCNGKDDDCDTLVDDGVLKTYVLDADGDGWGVSTTTTTGCTKPTGYAFLSGDCDDADPLVSPDGLEVCDDADTDENCNGLSDDGDWTVDTTTQTGWYIDKDGDGYGVSSSPVLACDAPTGRAGNTTDCDDTDATVHPGSYCFVGGTTTLTVGKIDAIAGLVSGDQLGWGLAGGGDCSGDGQPDLLVGSPAVDTTYIDAGRAFLVDSSPGGDEAVDAIDVATFSGTAANDRLGQVLAFMEDGNGDGKPEVIIASPEADQGSSKDVGVVALQRCPVAGNILTSYTARFYGGTSGDRAGAAVSGIGGNLAIGAPGAKAGLADWAGVVYLVSGSTTSASTSPISLSSTATGVVATLSGVEREEHAGSALAAGDFDGDGTVDLVVGAPGMSNGTDISGGIYIVYGPISGTKTLTSVGDAFTGLVEEDGVGSSLAVGDVDGDGVPDLALGAPLIDTVYVATAQTLYYYSSVSTSEGILTGDPGSGFGTSLAFLDTDGDGIDALAVGAPGATADGMSGAGHVALFLNPATYSDYSGADALYEGDTAAGGVGKSVTALDWDGDDWDELIIGAPGLGSGRAFVLWGYGPW